METQANDFSYKTASGELFSDHGGSCVQGLRYIDVTRATSATLDVMVERRIDDYWNIEGKRDLSDSWTVFTRFTILDEKPPDGYTWSRGAVEIWKEMSEAAQRKDKQKWAIETEA